MLAPHPRGNPATAINERNTKKTRGYIPFHLIFISSLAFTLWQLTSMYSCQLHFTTVLILKNKALYGLLQEQSTVTTPYL